MYFAKKTEDAQRMRSYLRRMCDLTSPSLPRMNESRGEDRENRTFPVLLAPWEGGPPVVSEAATALTKDISTHGFSLTLPQPFRAEEVVVGFWLPQVHGYDPWFFLGLTRQNVPIGGGYWALGIEATRFLTIAAVPALTKLLRLVQRLVPPKAIESARVSTQHAAGP